MQSKDGGTELKDEEKLGERRQGRVVAGPLVHERREAVNHPDHYGGADNPYEVIKIINAHDLNFDLGCVVKYVLRAGKKDDDKEVEDLEKAAWYLRDEIKKAKERARNRALRENE